MQEGSFWNFASKPFASYMSLASVELRCQPGEVPVPTLTHGSMFYLRQLWVYNFGIHDCSRDAAVMCMWNETIAGRGANEIMPDGVHCANSTASQDAHLLLR